MAAHLTGDGGVKYTGSGILNINSWNNDTENDYKGDTTVEGQDSDHQLTVRMYREKSFGNSSNVSITNANLEFLRDTPSFNVSNTLSLVENASIKAAREENGQIVDNGNLTSITATNYKFGSESVDTALSNIDIAVNSNTLNFNQNGKVSFSNIKESNDSASELIYSFASGSGTGSLDEVTLSNSKISYDESIQIATEKTLLQNASKLTVSAGRYHDQLGNSVEFDARSTDTSSDYNRLELNSESNITLENIVFSGGNQYDRISLTGLGGTQSSVTIENTADFTNYNGSISLTNSSFDLTTDLANRLFNNNNSYHGGLLLADSSKVSISGNSSVNVNNFGWSANSAVGGVLDLSGFNFDQVDDNIAALKVNGTYYVGNTTATVKIDESDFSFNGAAQTDTPIFDIVLQDAQLLIELQQGDRYNNVTLIDSSDQQITQGVLTTEYISNADENKQNIAALGTWGMTTNYPSDDTNTKYGLWLGYGLQSLELRNGHNESDASPAANEALDLSSSFMAISSETAANNRLATTITGHGILWYQNNEVLGDTASEIYVSGNNSYTGITLVDSDIKLHTQSSTGLGNSSLVLVGNNSDFYFGEGAEGVKLSLTGLASDSGIHSINIGQADILTVLGNNSLLAKDLIKSIEEKNISTTLIQGNVLGEKTSLTGSGTLQIGNESSDKIALTFNSASTLNDFNGTVKLVGTKSKVTIKGEDVLQNGKYEGSKDDVVEINTDVQIAADKADFSKFEGVLDLAEVTATVTSTLDALNRSAVLDLENTTFVLDSVANNGTTAPFDNTIKGTGTLNFQHTTDVSMDYTSKLTGFSGELDLDDTSKVTIKDLANINSTISADLENGTLLSLITSATDAVDWSGLTGSGTVELENTDGKTALTFFDVNEGFTGTAHLTNYTFDFGGDDVETNPNSQLVSQAAIVAENTDLTVTSAITSQGMELAGDSSLKFESEGDIKLGGDISSLITMAEEKTFTISGNNKIIINPETVNLVTSAIAEAGAPDTPANLGILGTVNYLNNVVDSRYLTLVKGSVNATEGSLTFVDEDGNEIDTSTGISVSVTENGQSVADIGYGTKFKTGAAGQDLFVSGGAGSLALRQSTELNAEKEIGSDFNLNVTVTADPDVDVVIAGNKALTLSKSNNSFTGSVTVNEEATLNLSSTNALGGNTAETSETTALIVNGKVNAEANQKAQTLVLNNSGELNLNENSLSLTKEKGQSSLSGKLTGSDNSALKLEQGASLTVYDSADISGMKGTYDLTAGDNTLEFAFNSNKAISNSSIKGGNIVKSGAGLLTIGFDMLSSEDASLSSLEVKQGAVAFDGWNDNSLNLRSVNLESNTVFNFTGKELNAKDDFAANNATVNFFANSSLDHVITGAVSGSGNTFDLTADGSFNSQSLTIDKLASGSDNTFVVGIDNTGAIPQVSQIIINEAEGTATQKVDLAYVHGDYDFADTLTFATVKGTNAQGVEFVGSDESLPSNVVRTDRTTVISAITPAYSIISNNNADQSVNWGFERNTAYDEISIVGDVMTDMANTVYASNVYLDTLNKRMGEARYVNGEDYGVWARVRHDSFNLDRTETMKTMAQVGLTQKNEFANGDWFVGAAFDYQSADSNYDRMNADSEQKRYGLWFTATYLADSGSYADFVFKYAHLETDNTFKDLLGFNKDLSADYDNESISLSAEFGHKFMNDAGWFIEPQIQAQYTYITDTDYSTAAGTDVSIDNIDSLIGRLGFRAGRSLNDTPLTFYLRADVMHEFLGDVDLTFSELGNTMTQSESNDDTYGSVGLGFSVMSTDNMKLFVEADTLFGGDYDDSYSISMGGKYQF
ncbi:autotransporter outer membrane beta-barrel domain-containing protein [Succinatimonas hippei]|uniref:Outer membrane autotransporter barrel domain protein n=1 Tax=Succinatimonas hippei (strain DSM 22608 / JCM 16073 / KCTC 15190 / YIT 12066) TaxID=762983 RepID=E8LJM0_SUCHY|nr:autotransporter outer membrane beta-barrel domain-containing protein [Succinatimonas hippei]EFY07318.1 outer membrane autotransporter barrel domain protein [Succinatimonas hippei YIT 12066]